MTYCTLVIFSRSVALANIMFAKCLPEHNCVCSKAEYVGGDFSVYASISPVCGPMGICYWRSDVLVLQNICDLVSST